MKLYTLEAEKDRKPLLVELTAKLMQVEGILRVAVADDAEALKKKSVTGRFPVLETADGAIHLCDSLPIARYLSRDNATFTGATLEAKAQVDTWVDMIQSTVVPAARRVLDFVANKVFCDKQQFSVALNELKSSLAPINEHLQLRNFLVGYSLTLADALLASTLAPCFELVLDKKTRDNAIGNLARYAAIIYKMAPCKAVFGAIAFCKDVTQPSYEKPKKEQAPKKEQPKKGGDQAQAAAGDKKQGGGKQKKQAKGGDVGQAQAAAAAEPEAKADTPAV